jgi:hypothetical protein
MDSDYSNHSPGIGPGVQPNVMQLNVMQLNVINDLMGTPVMPSAVLW